MISVEQNSFITALFLCNLMIESYDNFFCSVRFSDRMILIDKNTMIIDKSNTLRLSEIDKSSNFMDDLLQKRIT